MPARIGLLITCVALQCVAALAARAAAPHEPHPGVAKYQAWRIQAAVALAARDDANSMAAAAALRYVGGSGRSEALDLASRAANAKPDDPAIGWLRLELCASTPGCDMREAATTLRWIDADNAAAWLPSLHVAARDKDAPEVDRILAEMAATKHFDVYLNRLVTLLYDSLRRDETLLPDDYIGSDVARLSEALGVVSAEAIPTFGILQGACHDATGGARHEDCMRLAKILQRGDAIVTQMAGFNLEKHLLSTDGHESRLIAERRRTLAWRRAAANQFEATALPWIKNSRARSLVAQMRITPREEDVCMAVLHAHRISLDPPQEHR